MTKLTYSVTEMEMATAFAEWDRKFRENPNGFVPNAEILLKWSPEKYGEESADYFVRLLRGQNGTDKKPWWSL
jgi:hypothetical protein